MAEITPSPSSRSTRTRRRTPPVRVDMTPMVDLAFLLLTFFILTTSLRRLEGLDLLKPLGTGGDRATNTITFLLAGPDSIYGYAGPWDAHTTPRRMGLDQVRTTLAAIPDTTGLTLVVKPDERTRYGGLVDMLDEFARAGLPNYQITDSMTSAEREAIHARR